ncbi:MAG: glycosyltransferase family 2 protein [Firmicutes bacterium]|nr:glycosyltransferase family 2 protein [Bacillota bacterium]
MNNSGILPYFSVIMPAYNEESVVENTISDLITEMESPRYAEFCNTPAGKDWFEIVVTDDGSKDRTFDSLIRIGEKDKRIRIFRHDKNLGFGAAVMNSVGRAKGEKLLLVPSDGQFDPGEIIKFIKALDGYDLVIGVRPDRQGYNIFRKFVSFVYISLVKMLFGKSYKDTNWVQAWKRDVFLKIKPQSSGVFFLQETITLAAGEHFRTGEVPSSHIAREKGKASGGRLSVILFTLFEMLKFRFTTKNHGSL